MNKSILYLLSLATMLALGCRDFVEPNLRDKTVGLLAPGDNINTTTLTQTFWWQKLNGAAQYNLQIVKGTFSSIQQILVDTNVFEDKYTCTLQPGSYQWRVKAWNYSSETDYSTRSFVIDSTSSLTAQTLVLVSPASGLITNQSSLTFKWDTLYNADDYRFQVINSLSQTIVDVTVLTDSVTYALTNGTFTWQVRAQNSISNTLYSSRTITIDTIAPPVSTLSLPNNGDTIALPDTLFWTRNAAAMGDSLFIDTDSLFVSPLYISAYTTNTSYIVTTGTSGQKYYWRLRSRDAAGNWSVYSGYRRYKIQ